MARSCLERTKGLLLLVSLTLALSGCASSAPPAPPRAEGAGAAPAGAQQAPAGAASAAPGGGATAAGAAARPAAAGPTGTLTIGLSSYGPEERWLPWLSGIKDHEIIAAVYEYLFGREAGTDKMEPRLAERYEWSADNMILTIYLRKGIQFHDNRGELTAEDVKFSLERYMATDRAPGSPYYKSTIDSMVILDPHKLELRLTGPDWTLPYNLSNATPRIAIVSKKYVEAVGEDRAAEHPIGTGPFRFVEATRRSTVKLEAVENHWRKPPAMKTLIFRNIPESGTRLAALRAGEVDLIDANFEHVAELTGLGFSIIPIKHVQAVHISLGGQNPPDHRFYDARVPWVGPDPERALQVRQALSLAVDRAAIVQQIYAGQADPVAVPAFRPGAPWTDPALKPYPYEPAQAKELLARAGYPNGFPIKLMAVSGQASELPQLAEAVGSYWTRNLGLQVELVPIEWGTIRPKLTARDTLGIAWAHSVPIAMDPEPSVSYRNLWTCDGNYIILACSSEVDGYFKALLGEIDEAKRVALRKALAKTVYDNYYFVPIAQAHMLYAANPRKVVEWPLIPGMGYAINYEYLKLAQ